MTRRPAFTSLSWWWPTRDWPCGVVIVLLVVGSAGCVDLAKRNDLTAANAEDTGSYRIVASRQPSATRLEVTLKVENLDAADRIARDVAHQKAGLGIRQIQFDILGPLDADDGRPRRRIIWPEQLDYTRE